MRKTNIGAPERIGARIKAGMFATVVGLTVCASAGATAVASVDSAPGESSPTADIGVLNAAGNVAAGSGKGGVVAGRIVRNGAPVKGSIKIEIWPSQQYLDTLADDTEFDLLELPLQATDAEGDWTVNLPDALPSKYVADTGSINVEVVGTDGSTAVNQNMSVSRIDRQDGSVAKGTAVSAKGAVLGAANLIETQEERPEVEAVTLDVGTASARTAREKALAAADGDAADAAGTRVVSPASAFGLQGATAEVVTQMTASKGLAARSAAAPPIDRCAKSTGKRHGPYYETFATFYAAAHVKGRVVHNYETTHTLGVGFKLQGGSWGQAGTEVTKSSLAGYDTDYTIADANVRNRVWQRYYYTKCYSAGTLVSTDTYTKPAGFADGPYYTRAAHVNYARCSPGFASHTYHRTKIKNRTYSSGMDLPAINLSSQSGWSKTTEMHWKFSEDGKLCGSGNKVWSEARGVSARN